MKNLSSLVALSITTIVIICFAFILKKSSSKSNKQLIKALMLVIFCMVGWCFSSIAQIIALNFFSENLAKNFDCLFAYTFLVMLPVALLFFADTFKNKKLSFDPWFILYFIMPIIIILVIWTNDYHHLFFIHYSSDPSLIEFGPFYSYVHSVHCTLILAYAIISILKTSIKNTSVFSLQTILIVTSIILPVTINLITIFNIVPSTFYATPISFSISILLLRNCNI